MKKRCFTIFLLLIIAFGHAQEIPVLKVKDKQLGLSSLDISVEIVGNIATTTYDMLFFNPTNTVLEGELSFPLGEGHNVSRFALDINGKLREAVVVDKELGRVAFEQVVREGIDPALLEKGTGNNYKARIYPIPANGYKRVLLAYEQELTLNNNSQYYHLPLNFKNTLDKFKLELVVFDQKSKPLIEEGKISGLNFTNWEKNYRTKIEKKNYKPNKSLLIKIPTPKDVQKTLTFEDYFYLYKNITSKKRFRYKPEKITLFWDASLSMQERDLKKEVAFLNNYFAYLNNVEVTFISFSNILLSNKKFKIRNGNWSSLEKEISNIVYDGGTNYDIVLNNSSTTETVLIFSDGIASLNTPDFNKNTTTFIVNSIPKSNHSLLKNIAESSNGAYINLNTKTNSEAIDLAKYESYKFLGYSSNSKELEIFPKGPISVTNDFSISGKNFKKDNTLILHFGFNNSIDQKVSINLNDLNTENKNVKRIWAQKKLAGLETNSRKNKADIKTLGLEYSLVTDYTSLIVLDNVRDYIRFKITPPEELLEEYNTVLAQIEEDKKKQKALLKESDSNNSSLLGIINTSDGFTNTTEEIIEVEELEVEEVQFMMTPSMNREDVDDLPPADVSSPRNIRTGEEVSSNNNKDKLIVKDRPVITDYVKALDKEKNKKNAYALYLKQRKDYKNIPAYYVDVSNFFKQKFNEDIYSSRILSNIPESDFDNYELLKVFAYQLQYNDQHELAAFIFERILELRPEDSQSYRDLALAYEKIGKCQEALDLYYSIINGSIYKNKNRRVFEGVELITKNEIKHLINNYRDDLNLKDIDKKLLKNVNHDIRIVVDWNHNDTDIDLHIIDPNLEECYYSHPKTKIGGQMSQDMTQGFGPEEFTLSKAKKGDYFIKAKYYGDRYQKEENPTFMKVSIFKYYGTNSETLETKIIRLTKKDDQEIIAKLSF